MIAIKINDRQITQAVKRLSKAGGNLKPAMEDIGEYLTRATKKRFGKSEGRAPDGTSWKANTDATIAEFVRRKKGGTVKRPGEKIKSGIAAGKKPLIGESKRLGTEIHYEADANSVAVGSSEEQAAVMQFGAKKGEFGRTKRGAPIPWGDIPARPYLGLSEEDKIQTLEILNEHLAAAGSSPRVWGT